jgi:SAM-dependent methyltransferase
MCSLAMMYDSKCDAMPEMPVLPRELFQRIDESADERFYSEPRLVTHIDDATIAALTQVYRELVPAGAHVLDLMSSWVSHLPPEVDYGRVVGVGMNRVELARNPRLTTFLVHDLNRCPELPFADATFDAVLNAVSIQYLTNPVEVFVSVRRVLRPGGIHVVATSHRMFPTKAVAAWHSLEPMDRMRLIGAYFELAGGFGAPRLLDRSPCGADPLWVVTARRTN